MKENRYNDDIFFNKYALMLRSCYGLNGAGEWEDFKKCLPSFKDKIVLDLGCGYGWHSIYALKNGAKKVFAIDISSKMLAVAKEKAKMYNNIIFYQGACEDINKIDEIKTLKFDIAISSLVFHYIRNYKKLIGDISSILDKDKELIFSVEHPIFTANITQDFIYGEDRKAKYFPISDYFYEKENVYQFLGENIIKCHRTLTSYIEPLLQNNFKITNIIEPKPSDNFLQNFPEFKKEAKKEMLRPMMLIISCKKE